MFKAYLLKSVLILLNVTVEAVSGVLVITEYLELLMEATFSGCCSSGFCKVVCKSLLSFTDFLNRFIKF